MALRLPPLQLGQTVLCPSTAQQPWVLTPNLLSPSPPGSDLRGTQWLSQPCPFSLTGVSPNKIFACLRIPSWLLLLRGLRLTQKPSSNCNAVNWLWVNGNFQLYSSFNTSNNNINPSTSESNQLGNVFYVSHCSKHLHMLNNLIITKPIVPTTILYSLLTSELIRLFLETLCIWLSWHRTNLVFLLCFWASPRSLFLDLPPPWLTSHVLTSLRLFSKPSFLYTTSVPIDSVTNYVQMSPKSPPASWTSCPNIQLPTQHLSLVVCLMSPQNQHVPQRACHLLYSLTCSSLHIPHSGNAILLSPC